MGDGGTGLAPFWTVVALCQWAAGSWPLIAGYLAVHNIDITGWPTTRLLDLLYALPMALSLWVEKPYEVFDKIDAELNTPQYVTAMAAETWGLDADAQERMAAFMEMTGPSEWDPSKSFTPSYGAAPAPPPEPESAI